MSFARPFRPGRSTTASRHREALWNPWTFVRCQVAGKHRWEPVGDEDDLDTGWRCRDCDELVLKRYILERNHEPDLRSPYGGYGDGAGAVLPGP